MSAHNNTAEARAEIIALAKRIEEYRNEKKWTQAHLLREFSGLGSSKVLWAILEGKTDELAIDDTWLPEYRAVIALIEAEAEYAIATEDLYEDLLPVSELARVVAPLFRTDSNDRVVIIQGEPGSGKTTAARMIARRFASQVIMVEAADAWGDSPGALLGAILRRFGVQQLPAATSVRLDACLAHMRDGRRVIFVDEAHHLGPRGLNTLKTLVNQSSWGVVLLCIPTLWRKLERGAYEEARQLTTNRLAERVKLSCPVERDVSRILDRRLPGMDKQVAIMAAKLLHKDAQTHGGLSFVRDVAKRLSQQAERPADLTREDIARSIEKELASR
jgi:DNA transposition AAA+ family ATPase